MHRIPLNPILRDIRSGIGDDQVMKDYGLDPERFSKLLLKLVEQKFIRHEELYNISPTYKQAVKILQSRHSLRTRVPDAIRVYNRETSEGGFIRDVSEKGVRIAGLNVQIGESVHPLAPLKEIMSIKPLEFTATCRWTKIKGRTTKFIVAGFEITVISDEAKSQLLSLICMFQAGGSPDVLITRGSFNVREALQSALEMRSQLSTHDFCGMIDGVDILEFVQFVMLTGKRMLLQVNGSHGTTCLLYFDNGRVIHAVQGDLEGKEAFLRAMNLPRGQFFTKPWHEPNVQSIDLPGDFLLMEAARNRDDLLLHTGSDENDKGTTGYN